MDEPKWRRSLERLLSLYDPQRRLVRVNGLPGGECIETCDRDPRTLPLLASAAFTLQPGELTWRAARPV